MTNTPHSPESLAKVQGFVHGMEVPAGSRMLFVAGQVGWRADGGLESGFEAQCERTFANVFEVLKSAGMGPGDIVRLNSYLTDPRDIGAFRAIRDRVMGGHLPASTLVVVNALVHPDMRVEVECVAAKA